MSSSTAASATTMPMNSGSLVDSTCVKSMPVAVLPPIMTVVPVLWDTRGSTSLRSFLTRLVVALACGAVAGYACITTVRP